MGELLDLFCLWIDQQGLRHATTSSIPKCHRRGTGIGRCKQKGRRRRGFLRRDYDLHEQRVDDTAVTADQHYNRNHSTPPDLALLTACPRSLFRSAPAKHHSTASSGSCTNLSYTPRTHTMCDRLKGILHHPNAHYAFVITIFPPSLHNIRHQHIIITIVTIICVQPRPQHHTPSIHPPPAATAAGHVPFFFLFIQGGASVFSFPILALGFTKEAGLEGRLHDFFLLEKDGMPRLSLLPPYPKGKGCCWGTGSSLDNESY